MFRRIGIKAQAVACAMLFLAGTALFSPAVSAASYSAVLTNTPVAMWVDDFVAISPQVQACVSPAAVNGLVLIDTSVSNDANGVPMPAGTYFICDSNAFESISGNTLSMSSSAWTHVLQVGTDGHVTELTYQNMQLTLTISAVHGVSQSYVSNGQIDTTIYHDGFPAYTGSYGVSSNIVFDAATPPPTCDNGATDYPTCTPPSTGGSTGGTTPTDANDHAMTQAEFHQVVHNYAIKAAGLSLACVFAYFTVSVFRWRPW